MRMSGRCGSSMVPSVAGKNGTTSICNPCVRDQRALKSRSNSTKDTCWTEWLKTAGGSDEWVTSLIDIPVPPVRVRTLPPPPNFPPPPVPVGKACDVSTCSVISDESTDCVSEPPEQLDAPGSEIGEQSELLDVPISEIGEQAFMMCSIEIDFDSLEFELGPDDVSDHPSSIRAAPSANADEVDSELKLLMEFGGTCGSTRLNSRAKAWIPEARPPSASIGMACSQMLDILIAAQAAMAASEFVLDGEIFQRPQGWAITMYVHATNLVHKEQIIALGKTALIESSKRSRSIYVVGYRSQPFVNTPMGFTAILCEVENSSDACWTFIKNGRCRYRSGCKWQHPSKPVIDVMIKIK